MILLWFARLTLRWLKRLVLEQPRVVLLGSVAVRDHLPDVGLSRLSFFLKRWLALGDADGVHSSHGGSQISRKRSYCDSRASSQLVLELLVEKFGHARHIGARSQHFSPIQ